MIPRFLTGVAVGYVLGTRAGRERYEQLVESWREFNDTDLMQQVRGEVTKLTSGDTGTGEATAPATPAVVAGPAPAVATGTADADVVLPDLESSTAASLPGDIPVAAPRTRKPTPPKGA